MDVPTDTNYCTLFPTTGGPGGALPATGCHHRLVPLPATKRGSILENHPWPSGPEGLSYKTQPRPTS